MEEIFAYLRACGVFYLATVEGAQPRVRPLHALTLLEGRLYIRVGRTKGVAAQLLENPRCEVCAFSGKDWLRITCRALPAAEPKALAALNDAFPLREGDGEPMAFCLCQGTAQLSRYAQPMKTVCF